MTRGQFKLASSDTLAHWLASVQLQSAMPLSLSPDWFWLTLADLPKECTIQAKVQGQEEKHQARRKRTSCISVNGSVWWCAGPATCQKDPLHSSPKRIGKTLPFPQAILIFLITTHTNTHTQEKERPQWAESDVWFNYCSYIMNYYYNCHCYYANSHSYYRQKRRWIGVGALTFSLTLPQSLHRRWSAATLRWQSSVIWCQAESPIWHI